MARKKTPAAAAPGLVAVILAVPRSGPGGAQNRGQAIEVGPAEALRLHADRQIEPLDAETLAGLSGEPAPAPEPVIETAAAVPDAAIETRDGDA